MAEPGTTIATSVVVSVNEPQMPRKSSAIWLRPICASRSRPNSHNRARFRMLHRLMPSAIGHVNNRHTSPPSICCGA